MKPRGFTLIELLVVISIIGLLSSIVLASVNTARAKAGDAKAISEFDTLRSALLLYYHDNNRMPSNPNTHCYQNESGNWGSCACTPGVSYFGGVCLEELVTGKYVSSYPISQNPSAYFYYDYGPGNIYGAMLGTVLVAIPDTTTGISGTCRPWLPAQNWCDQASNKYYCLCLTY